MAWALCQAMNVDNDFCRLVRRILQPEGFLALGLAEFQASV